MAPASLYVGEKQQQCWKVVALWKALAIHQAFALEDFVSQQEAVGRDEIDLGVVRPARKQALQDARRRALADRDAARHSDDVGNLGPLDMQELLGGAEQLLGCRDIEIEKARDRQIDRYHLVEIDAIVETAQRVEIGLGESERSIGPELCPIFAGKFAI